MIDGEVLIQSSLDKLKKITIDFSRAQGQDSRDGVVKSFKALGSQLKGCWFKSD